LLKIRGLSEKLMDKGSGLRQGLSIAMRLGTEMVVATSVGTLMGYALDRLFGTKPWFLVAGVLFGGAAGSLSVYRTAMLMTIEESNEQDDKNDKEQ
jgi:ATP synthase protein I